MDERFSDDEEGSHLLDDDTCKAKIASVLRSDRFDQSCPKWCLRRQIVRILRAPEEQAHYGLSVDSKMLLEMDVQLGHLVLRYPHRMLRLFRDAVQDYQRDLLQRGLPLRAQGERLGEASQASGFSTQPSDVGGTPGPAVLKPNVHVRLQWLPAANRKTNISSIRQSDVNTLLQISGTVVRSGQLKVLESEKVFSCGNPKCTSEVRVRAALNEVGGMLQRPKGPCPHCRRSSSYSELKGRGQCWDYQEIRVQEQVQRIGMGSVPRSITVLLLHELVDSCKAGDDVVVTGVPMQRWENPTKDARCQLETVIQASSINVLNENRGAARLTEERVAEFEDFWEEHEDAPLEGRNLIVKSLCPQLHGLFLIKLATALSLVGAPGYRDHNGTHVRGDIHMLLVGDPGTGKSHCLRYAAKIASRSVLTTGVGTTSAGLTCTAVRDGQEYQLASQAACICMRRLSSHRETRPNPRTLAQQSAGRRLGLD